MPEPVLLDEREIDNGVVVDHRGYVIHNAWQMDDPIIVRDYDDGMRHIASKRTGAPIIAPFNPLMAERAHCPHCNGELGG